MISFSKKGGVRGEPPGSHQKIENFLSFLFKVPIQQYNNTTMPVYFGLPITCQETYRIFDIDLEMVKRDLIERKNINPRFADVCCFADELNKHFKQCGKKVRLFSTDKGQFVLGYEIAEVSDVWTKFINMDELVILLAKLKSQFGEEMLDLKADLKKVTLEYMEGDEENPDTVSFPTPYVISFNG